MTREEVIKILKQRECCRECVANCTCNECDKAFEMAIEALKQEPCEDTISRKAVLETIDDCNSDGLKGIFCSYGDGERFKEYIKELPSVIPKGVTVTDFADKCRECGKMRITCKTVTLTPFEIKMMQMSLYHQWFRMTDDNGEAINCEQKSADCVFDLMNRFEKLRAEVEQEEKE